MKVLIWTTTSRTAALFLVGKQLWFEDENLAEMDLEPASDLTIPRQSLTSAVSDKLRDQIIRGQIPEGAQLRQDAIASQYQVNRIPVREALRQLDAEGLIAIVPNRGLGVFRWPVLK